MMKIVSALLIFLLLISEYSDVWCRKKKLSKPDNIPTSVWEASNFISQFHQRIFVDNVFKKISQPYLTSLTDEDIPDINVVNTLASVLATELIEKPRTHLNNDTDQTNLSQNASSSSEDNGRKLLTTCEKYDYRGSPVVEIVDIKRFEEIVAVKSNITNRTSPSLCVLVLFYAQTCPFSAMAAPHFNALARTFPSIKLVAINTKKYQIVNSQFGIVGVPTLMLFHNGRPVLKFNRHQYTLAQFSKFITRCTGIIADHKMFVASVDFGGPLPGIPKQETDYFLVLSCTVLTLWFVKCLLKIRYLFIGPQME